MTDKLTTFVRAYDRWAHSSEQCGGPLFDAMVEARKQLQEQDAPSQSTMAEDDPYSYLQDLIDAAYADGEPADLGPDVQRRPGEAGPIVNARGGAIKAEDGRLVYYPPRGKQS